MSYKVLLFYKYVKIENPEKFRNEHYDFCVENNILGRIYVAEEGINATVSGSEEDIIKYKQHLTSDPRFNDVWFKEDPSNEHAFSKLIVKVKKEIVNSGGLEVNPEYGGTRLKAEDLQAMYENEDDFIIVDARNDYEYKIGHFKNAIKPDVTNFREWKEFVEELKEHKEKKVVAYCTGGIRCEKATAYMVQQGFKNVYQLEGGIVSYTKNFPDQNWLGSIFVFDERRIISPNSRESLRHTAECFYCGEPASYYINCHNQNCDKLLITCHSCKEKYDYCCSDECRTSPNRRKIYHG
ncbi:MAG: UPF0176 protein YbfQ [Melioribacteraceae bacterium]|nr:MAG: UPF0176 protein YbfQ [Melioribacteraceae bacterium]